MWISPISISKTRIAPIATGFSALSDSAISSADLAWLSVTPGSLEPVFDPEVLAYVVNLPHFASTLRIQAQPTDPDAEVSLNGTPSPGLSGDWIVAVSTGAQTFDLDIQSASDQLSANYSIVVHRADATSVVQQQFIKAPNAGGGDLFGNAIAIDDDTFVVGAPLEDGELDDVTSGGAAYIYALEDGTWAHQATLRADDRDADDRFGSTMAASGNTVVVGVPGDDGDGNATLDTGAAYIFSRTDGGEWRQVQVLRPSPEVQGAAFGASLVMLDDLLAIGRPHRNAPVHRAGRGRYRPNLRARHQWRVDGKQSTSS